LRGDEIESKIKSTTNTSINKSYLSRIYPPLRITATTLTELARCLTYITLSRLNLRLILCFMTQIIQLRPFIHTTT